jgi:hypothetical protein
MAAIKENILNSILELHACFFVFMKNHKFKSSEKDLVSSGQNSRAQNIFFSIA